MKPSRQDTFPIAELADALGVTAKTIRNRVARGVYSSPERGLVSLSGEVERELEAAKADAAADLEAFVERNWPSIVAEIEALPAVKGGAHE